jgi:hypothetical protein
MSKCTTTCMSKLAKGLFFEGHATDNLEVSTQWMVKFSCLWKKQKIAWTTLSEVGIVRVPSSWYPLPIRIIVLAILGTLCSNKLGSSIIVAYQLGCC